MTLTVSAGVYLIAKLPDNNVQSITDHELLVCLQHVAPPSGRFINSAMAISARLRQATLAVRPPADANEVHQHVFNIWKAMREIMDKTRSWDHFKVGRDMFGAGKPSAAKAYSRIMLEMLQPVAFRETCQALFVVDTSTLEDPSAFIKLIRDQGLSTGRTSRGCLTRNVVLGVVAEEKGASLATRVSIVNVRLPVLHALQQTSTRIPSK